MMQHAESFEYLVYTGPFMTPRFQARPSPPIAVLRVAVKLLETGLQLAILTLEHLDIAVDGEWDWIATGKFREV